MRRRSLLASLVLVAACHHGDAPPPAPSCTDAADHVRSLLSPGAPRASRIRDAFVERCEADGWDDEARSCVVATTSLRKPRHCKDKLTRDQRAALDHDLGAVAALPARPALGALPPACRDYGSMIDRLVDCAALPGSARAALELAYSNLTRAWRRGSYDPEALELQCRAMIDGLLKAVSARCSW
ncbi:MAG TPA: hypothetical protein VHW23_18200 [Kofleriaceae bacterium]|nr:hypothetical protein [Kofleriaceae bacterium]